MATWSSQVGPVFAGAVAVACNGAVGALACGAWSAVALTASAKSRRAIFYVSLLQRPARGVASVDPLDGGGARGLSHNGVAAERPCPRRVDGVLDGLRHRTPPPRRVALVL